MPCELSDRIYSGFDAKYCYDSSEINRKGSPLLRLPAELRHRIFTYALSDRVLVRPAISSAIHNGSASSMHNLPLVCRQLYHETHLLVYRLGLFDIKKPRWFAEFISGGEQAKKSIIEVRISSSDLYLMAQTTYEFVADMFAPHFEVFNYRRCAAGFHDLANLQRVVVTPSLVLYSRTVDHFLRCQEVNHPDQVAWAVQQITGREDVEILLTYSHSDEDYMDSSDEEDSDRLCFELLGF